MFAVLFVFSHATHCTNLMFIATLLCHFSWKDRRLRRVLVFLFCLDSAIFKLIRAKFQTFAYDLRTVWSSFMKLGQQFEISKMFVCIKF